MKLIENWRKSWRMLSVQAMTAAAAIQGAWASVPEDMKASIPPGLVHWVTLSLLVLGIAGRLVDQPKVKQ